MGGGEARRAGSALLDSALPPERTGMQRSKRPSRTRHSKTPVFLALGVDLEKSNLSYHRAPLTGEGSCRFSRHKLPCG